MKNPELLFGLTTLYCCHAENASEEHSKKIRKKTFYWQSLMTYVGYVNPFWPDENLSNFVKKTIKYFPYQFSIELMPFLFIYKRVSIDFINMLFFEMVEKFKIELYRKSIIVQQNDEGWVSYYKLTKFKIAWEIHKGRNKSTW